MSRQYPGGYHADLAAETSASVANARPERAGVAGYAFLDRGIQDGLRHRLGGIV
jgi:hypothetical protein